MRKELALLVFVLGSTQAQAKDVLIDVPEIVGKSKAEVSAIIGKEKSCMQSKYGEKCTYSKAETEIIYIKGKSDWITVEGLDSEPFNNSTMAKLGLSVNSPSFSNAFTKRWDNLNGLLSVSLFKGGKNADYAYIKAKTK